MPAQDPVDDFTAIVDPNEEGLTPGPRTSGAKLPPPPETGDDEIDRQLREAWAAHVKNGFANADRMFEKLLTAFIRPYYITVILYIAMFVVGVGLLLLSVIFSLARGEPVAALIFAGLGAGMFLAFFVAQPLRALEQNQAFVTWLGVSYNSYWARIYQSNDRATVQADIKAANEDFTREIERLLDKQSELAGKRPGSTIESK